jgi:hypothetical protein
MPKSLLYMTLARKTATANCFRQFLTMRQTPVSDRPHLSLALLQAGMSVQRVALLNDLTHPMYV